MKETKNKQLLRAARATVEAWNQAGGYPDTSTERKRMAKAIQRLERALERKGEHAMIARCGYCGRKAHPMSSHEDKMFCSDACRDRWLAERREALEDFISQPRSNEPLPRCRCALPEDFGKRELNGTIELPKEVRDRLMDLSWNHPSARNINSRITLADVEWLSTIGIRW